MRGRRRETTWGLLAAGGALAAWTGIFLASGALLPRQLPSDASSAREITGMALMLILMPPFLIAAGTVGRERSLELVDQLEGSLPDPAQAERARDEIRRGLQRTWPLGLALGLLLSVFNTQPLSILRHSRLVVLEGSLSFGQVFLWSVIGLLLVSRFRVSRAFAQLGREVHLDLLRVDRLRPLARAGLVDMAVIAGALLFTPLQSLDAEFRWENYRFGLLVALPASAFFLLWPLVPLHERLRQERERRVRAIEAEIDALGMPAPSATAELDRLETLLAHRDRLAGVSTWPLGTRLLSRVFLYLVIPPLAWAGAALVERLVEQLLEG